MLVYVNFWISDNDLSKRQKIQFFLFSKNALKYTKKKGLYLFVHIWINLRGIPRTQSKMDNSEKLATYGRQDEEKQNKNTTRYVLDTIIHKQTQKTQ